MFDIEHRKLALFWLRLLLLRSSSDRPVVFELSAGAKKSQMLSVRKQLASLQGRRREDDRYRTGIRRTKDNSKLLHGIVNGVYDGLLER